MSEMDEDGTEIDLDTQKESLVTANPEDQEEKSKLSFLQGLGLVIGLQIGSGIFSSPNEVHKHAGSTGMSLTIWVLSGLLAWSGASCYAELGSAIPASGGTQAYLARIYNEYASFLFSWSALIVLKPGSMAIIAIVLAEYVTSHPVYRRLVAILAVVGTSLVCATGKGASAGSLFLALKAILLVGIAVLGVVVASLRSHTSTSMWAGTHSFGDIIAALYGGIWAYDGWDNLNFLTGDMKNPKRDLPLVISTSMPTVIVVYCLLNAIYLWALGGRDLDASNSVALTLAEATSHKAVEIVVAGGIVISCAGALNAAMVSSTKLVQVVGKSKVLPDLFQDHKWAISLQAVTTIGYCCIGEFSELVTFYGSAGYIFYLATVVGMILLRVYEPKLPRPYRSWLVAPIAFIILSAAIIIRTTITHPILILILLLFIFAGSPWYYYVHRDKQIA